MCNQVQRTEKKTEAIETLGASVRACVPSPTDCMTRSAVSGAQKHFDCGLQ